jgi:hypothetical protein
VVIRSGRVERTIARRDNAVSTPEGRGRREVEIETQVADVWGEG